MSATAQPITADTYARIFDKARQLEYPAIDQVERDFDHKISRRRLEDAARILACPVKQNPPHWQHGRVIYAVTCGYLKGKHEPVTLLDIGTAKGFSALCLQWALQDADRGQLTGLGSVISLDVLDPHGTERRNSVLELDGPKTLVQFLEPWPESKSIVFEKIEKDARGAAPWILSKPGRIHLAYVDGKHSKAAVSAEGKALSDRQQPGDVVIWDDIQEDEVAGAVSALRAFYTVQYVTCCSYRTYAIGVRR